MADHARSGAQGAGQKINNTAEGQDNGAEKSLNFGSLGPTPEALEAGRKLFAGGCEFFYAAQQLEGLPAPQGVEIAFAGRSNVGKSSLLNALTGRKALARVSHQPGRTRQLNFFQCQNAPLVLVDMPGYGYAEAPASIKRDWQGLMLDYLRGRPNLHRVFLLLDSRVEIKTADETVMELLDQSAVSYQLILTKADDVKPAALKRKQDEVQALTIKHPAAFPQIITTSSQKGTGIEPLRATIAGFV